MILKQSTGLRARRNNNAPPIVAPGNPRKFSKSRVPAGKPGGDLAKRTVKRLIIRPAWIKEIAHDRFL
jgi:hypothetical protein